MNAFQILGVSPEDSIQTIRTRYRNLVKCYHPDQNNGKTGSEEKLKEINCAYSEIKRIKGNGGESVVIRYTVSLEDVFYGRTILINYSSEEGNRQVEIAIPRGIEHNSKLVVRKMGIRGGDLFVIIAIHPHPFFERVGENLITYQRINALDLIIGCTLTLRVFDQTIDVVLPRGTQHGQKHKVAQMGMPTGDRRGDLIVVVEIFIPLLEQNVIDKIKQIKLV